MVVRALSDGILRLQDTWHIIQDRRHPADAEYRWTSTRVASDGKFSGKTECQAQTPVVHCDA